MRQGFVLSILLTGICLFTTSVFATGGDMGGGDGSKVNPYLIEDLDDFDAFADPNNATTYWASGVHTKLMTDIDLSGRTYTTAVIAPDTDAMTRGYQGNSFTGRFNGNGQVISNFIIDSSSSDYLSFVGGNKGIIQDIKIENIYINTGNETKSVGGLCAYNNSSGLITFCSSNATIVGGDGSSAFGGFCGTNHGVISNCSSSGAVNCGQNSNSIGGFCGNTGGQILNCFSETSLDVTTIAYGVGGFCGQGGGNIVNSYSVGTIFSLNLASFNSGGFCGSHQSDFRSCFWDMEASGLDYSDGGIGLKTLEMKSINTFLDAGWDFVSEDNNGTSQIWYINSGNYPRLAYFSSSYGRYSFEGTGTLNNPYLIHNVYDMGNIYQDVTACYRLVSNIDFDGINWSNAVIPYFAGTFYGDQHEFYNLTLANSDYLGLFGVNKGKIFNLVLLVVKIPYTDYLNYGGTFCGTNDGEISNCFTTGSITLGDSCFHVGGFCGENTNVIDECFSWCYLYGNTDSVNVGGLCGENRNGDIINSYCYGFIIGKDNIGGLIGHNRFGSHVTNCYSLVEVTGYGSNVGGLIGENFTSTVISSYWSSEASQQSSSAAGTKLTLQELKERSSYIGWDFIGESSNGTNEIWRLCDDGNDFPRLSRVQARDGDFVCGDGTDIYDLQALAEHWLMTDALDPATFSYACDANGDGVIDLLDYAVLGSNW